MSRYYTPDGYHFSGNRIHPDELGSINAQLAEGAVGVSSLESVTQSLPRPRRSGKKERYSRPFRSTVLERFQGSPALLQSMAEMALHNALPDRWHVSEQGAYDEHIRDRRLDLLQEIGELGVEAAAA